MCKCPIYKSRCEIRHVRASFVFDNAFFLYYILYTVSLRKNKTHSHNPVKNIDILAHSFSRCGSQQISGSCQLPQETIRKPTTIRDSIPVAILVHCLRREGVQERICIGLGDLDSKGFRHSYQDGKLILDKTHYKIFEDWWTQKREGLKLSPDE